MYFVCCCAIFSVILTPFANEAAKTCDHHCHLHHPSARHRHQAGRKIAAAGHSIPRRFVVASSAALSRFNTHHRCRRTDTARRSAGGRHGARQQRGIWQTPQPAVFDTRQHRHTGIAFLSFFQSTARATQSRQHDTRMG